MPPDENHQRVFVLLSAPFAAAAQFDCSLLRFTPLFTSDWYVQLRSGKISSTNLGIVAHSHHTVPAVAHGKTGGVMLNFEVEDPDAHPARLIAAGVPTDVIRPIPPSAEFAA